MSILCHKIKRANITGPNSSNRHQSVMDSLPREITDEIIDNLPLSGLRSSSLVAKQWRKRSQQRVFQRIRFVFEPGVKTWHMNTREDPDRIPSYVQSANFYSIKKWSDSALFSNVLENFSSLNQLGIHGIEITDEMAESIQSGRFGEGVTTLHVWSPICSISTVISMILSLPNLQRLFIENKGNMSGEAPPTYHATSRREPLTMLTLHGDVGEAVKALAESHFVSRRLSLSLDAETLSTRQFLVLSSEILNKLTIGGVQPWYILRDPKK